MDALQKAREAINEIDREMARLFELRMDAVKQVALYKIENAMPVDDLGREAEIITRNAGYIDNKEYESYYVEFLKNNIRLSKELQCAFMEQGLSVHKNTI